MVLQISNLAIGEGGSVNALTAINWGIGQLRKGGIAFLSGFLLGRAGMWKMGPDYGHFKNYKPFGALARVGRDAFVRFLIRYPLTWVPYQFVEDWFL